MDIKIKSDKTHELKKHVYTIHCSNQLSLLERKAFNALLYKAYNDLPTQAQFKISITELSELIGYNSNDIALLKKTLRSLVNTVIEWDLLDSEKKQNDTFLRVSTALSSAEIFNGICTYEYSSIMRKHLYHPEMYAKIKMCIASKFKSNYALALYENCIRYINMKKTPWLEIEVFRKLMGVTEHQYTEMRDFSKRVIKKAIEEINEYSNINVDFEYKKEGRKTIAIRFHLLEKHKHVLSQNNVQKNTEIHEKMTKTFHLSDILAFELLDKYGEQYVTEKIDIILSSESYKTGKIESISGYLMHALKNNYFPNENVTKKHEINRKKIEKEISEKNRQDKIKRQQKEDDLYFEYRSTYITSILENIETDILKEMENKFYVDIIKSNPFYVNVYKKFGANAPSVKALFNSFLLSNYSRLFVNMLEKDNYISSIQSLIEI